jgi:protein-tyrosine phosphatase
VTMVEAPQVRAHWAPVGGAWRKVGRVLTAALGSLTAFILLGNLVIVLAWQFTARSVDLEAPRVEGVDNLVAVDDRLWRSAAPSDEAYEGLAAHDVRTIVDLRSGDGSPVDEALLERLDIDLVHIPVRDGQIPSKAEVDEFLDVVQDSPGRVLVHCGAGVGRTGAMVAAYRSATGLGGGTDAMRQNLAVGPPSLEQLVFASRIEGGASRPPLAVVVTSRVLDAPRRLWSRYG